MAKIIYVLLLLVLMYFNSPLSVAETDYGQVIQQLSTQQNQPWYAEYFFPALAIFIAPLMGVKLTNKTKDCVKKLFGKAECKIHKVSRWVMFNLIHFLSTALFSSMFWFVKYPIIHEAIVIGSSVAILQTSLVAVLFYVIGLFAPKLAEDLTEGVKYDDDSLYGRTIAAVAGRDDRRSDRHGVREAWTQQERERYDQEKVT